jgi:hypothetical protein
LGRLQVSILVDPNPLDLVVVRGVEAPEVCPVVDGGDAGVARQGLAIVLDIPSSKVCEKRLASCFHISGQSGQMTFSVLGRSETESIVLKEDDWKSRLVRAARGRRRGLDSGLGWDNGERGAEERRIIQIWLALGPIPVVQADLQDVSIFTRDLIIDGNEIVAPGVNESDSGEFRVWGAVAFLLREISDVPFVGLKINITEKVVIVHIE